MLRPELTTDECTACRTCTACDLALCSCCRPVPCERTGRWHACACPESHPKESVR